MKNRAFSLDGLYNWNKIWNEVEHLAISTAHERQIIIDKTQPWQETRLLHSLVSSKVGECKTLAGQEMQFIKIIINKQKFDHGGDFPQALF